MTPAVTTARGRLPPPAPPPATGGGAGAPLIWLVVVYLGSLAALLLTACGRRTRSPAEVVRIWTLDNFTAVLTEPLYREVLLRTVLVAVAVTLIDLALALPIAFYMAKVARPRVAKLLVVACLMPLWASYLIKAYAWRLLVIKDGGVRAAPSAAVPASVWSRWS